MLQAKDYDRFRKEYQSMSPREVRDFYKQIHRQNPNQNYFSIGPVLEFFSKTRSKTVFELGGANGELAKAVLKESPKIQKWDNFEIDLWDQVVTDPRYYFYVPNSFVWNDCIGDYDTLVLSHVAEHISSGELKSLFFHDTDIHWVYIDYPEKPKEGWTGTCAHVNEMFVGDVKAFMSEIGFQLFMDHATGVENSSAMGFCR